MTVPFLRNTQLQIESRIDLPHQMIFGNRVAKVKLVEQLTLVALLTAHHGSTSSRFASTQRNRGSRVNQNARGVLVAKRLDFIVDFKQPKHDIHQCYQPEGQRRVDASGDLPRSTQQRSGIEMLSPATEIPRSSSQATAIS
jgi:hypothetical protein